MEEAEEDAYIRISKHYMEEHYTDDTLSRNKIAQSVNLTPSYFGRILFLKNRYHCY